MKALKRFDDEVLAHKIDGLRFALYSVRRAFSRVEVFCRANERANEAILDQSTCLDVFMDCWQVIDGADRARQIVEDIPYWERQKEQRRSFVKAVKHVRPYRNLFHHLGSEAEKLPTSTASVMGSLSWVSKDNPRSSHTMLLVTGSIKPSYPGLIFDRDECRFLSDFSFYTAGSEVSLSSIAKHCDDFWISLDGMLEEAGAYASDAAPAIVIGVSVP